MRHIVHINQFQVSETNEITSITIPILQIKTRKFQKFGSEMAHLSSHSW